MKKKGTKKSLKKKSKVSAYNFGGLRKKKMNNVVYGCYPPSMAPSPTCP